MKPEECAKLASCEKIRMIMDKDMLDFDAIRDVCAKCGTGEKQVLKVWGKEKYSIKWEDCGQAGFNYLDCECGHRLIEDACVEDGETLLCPKCGRKYRCIWKGMIIEEIFALPSDNERI